MKQLSYGEMMWRERMAAREQAEDRRLLREGAIGFWVAIIACGFAGMAARVWMVWA